MEKLCSDLGMCLTTSESVFIKYYYHLFICSAPFSLHAAILKRSFAQVWKIINRLLHMTQNIQPYTDTQGNPHWVLITILTLLWKATASKSISVQRCLCQKPLNIYSLAFLSLYMVLSSFHAIFQQIKTSSLEALKRATYWVPSPELFLSEKEREALLTSDEGALSASHSALNPLIKRHARESRPMQPNPYKPGVKWHW